MYYTKQVVYEINYEMWNCPNSWFEILSRSYVSIAIPPRMQKESSGGLITSHIFSFYQGLDAHSGASKDNCRGSMNMNAWHELFYANRL